MTALLHTENLSRRFPGNRGVADFSVTLEAGDILGLVGLNGAGKTTTLAMLAGVLRPSSGRVLVENLDVRRGEARRRIGFAPDQTPLYPELTVIETLKYSAALYGLSGKAAAEASQRVMTDWGLTDVARRVVRTLSRGYRQRLGLARALVHRPTIALLDEPTEGLDPRQTAGFRDRITEHAGEGAVLLSTHQMEVIAGLCNRLLILHDGRVVHAQRLGNESGVELHALLTDAIGEVAA